MSTESNARSNNVTGMSRTWKVCLSLFAACLLLSIGGILVWRIGLNNQVDSALAKIRERGEPTTLSELEAFYEYPAGEDATSLYLEAFSQLDREFNYKRGPVEVACKSFPIALKDWPQEQDVENFENEYAHVLAKLHDAADMGGATRHPLDNFYNNGNGGTWDHLYYIDDAAFLLRTEALLHARRNNTAGVMRTLAAINRLGESLKNKPLSVSQIGRYQESDRLVKIIGQTLHRVKFSDKQLAELKLMLTSVNLRENLKRSIAGGRVLDLLCFDSPLQRA